MSEDDYQVGYGNPPKHTQFKKGQSGNPKGRPKGVKNLTTDLQEELESKIQITEDGKQKTVTKQRAMLKQMLQKAMNGDARSADVLIKLAISIEESKSGIIDDEELAAEDEAILDAYLKKQLEEKQT